MQSETTISTGGASRTATFDFWRFEVYEDAGDATYLLVTFAGCQLAQHLDVNEEIRRFWSCLERAVEHLGLASFGLRLLVNTNMIEPHLVIFLDRFLGEQREVDLVAWRGFGSSQEVCSQVRRFTITQSRVPNLGPRGVISQPFSIA